MGLSLGNAPPARFPRSRRRSPPNRLVDAAQHLYVGRNSRRPTQSRCRPHESAQPSRHQPLAARHGHTVPPSVAVTLCSQPPAPAVNAGRFKASFGVLPSAIQTVGALGPTTAGRHWTRAGGAVYSKTSYAAHTTFRLCTSVRRRQRMTKMYCRSIGSRLAATMKPSLSATLCRTTVHGRGCQSLRKNKAKSWVTCYSLRFASLTPNLTSGSPFWLP